MTQIVSTIASADAATTFGSDTLPDFEGVIAEHWFGGSEEAATLNRITGTRATVIGAPGYQRGFARIGYGGGTGTNGFLLDVGCPPAISVIALVRQPLDNNPIILATKDDPTSFNLVFTDRGHVSCGNGQTYGATDQSIVALPDPEKFSLVMGVGLLGTPSRILLRTAGGTILDDGSPQFVPNARPSGVFQIGGQINAQRGGDFEIVALAIVAAGRGSTYLDQLYPRWKAKAEAAGLPVN